MNPPAKLKLGVAIALGLLLVLEAGCRLLPVSWRTTEKATAIIPAAATSGASSAALVAARMGTSTAVPGWDLPDHGSGALGLAGSEVDDLRMRSPGYAPEKGDAVRLLFAGDSCSFGFGLAWNDTFAARAARLRQGRFPAAEYQAAACAVPGHSSLQTRVKLEHYCMAFAPDLVFIASQFNDAALSDIPDVVRFRQASVHRAMDTLRRSALFAVVSRLLAPGPEPGANDGKTCASGWLPPGKDLCPDVVKDVNRVSLDDYRDNLRAMIEVARAGGAAPVLIVLPHRVDWETGSVYPFHAYRDAMRTVAEQEQVPLVDGPAAMLASGKSPDDLFLDRLHPSARGARVIALAIDRALGGSAP